MHTSSLLRMEWFVNKYLSNEKNPQKRAVLDVGSYDVNGSYKHLFSEDKFDYTGLDMVEGPNVDIVPAHPYDWKNIESGSYDVVISGQAFEHIEFFWVTFAEMVRVLKNGGIMCLTAPRLHPLHRYPVDCYRFDTDGMLALAKYGSLIPLHASVNSAPPGADPQWYGQEGDALLVAAKPDTWSGMLDIANYTFSENDIETLNGGFLPQPETLPGLLHRIKMLFA